MNQIVLKGYQQTHIWWVTNSLFGSFHITNEIKKSRKGLICNEIPSKQLILHSLEKKKKKNQKWD